MGGHVARSEARGRSQRRLHQLGAAAVLSTLAVAYVTAVLWPRNDVPRDPDVVAVLGGAGLERARLGDQLRLRHDATLVLSAQAIDYATSYLGIRCGVDARCIDPAERSTAGEARAIAALADAEGWRHVTVATSRFHSTRARVLFRQCLGDRVTVVGARPTDHHRGPGTYLREAVGTLAAITVQRAC
jgi:hypothetical protein